MLAVAAMQEVVGPYIYRRIRRKVDTWWDKEGRVSVKEWSYYLPIDEEQQGEGSSDDHKPGLAAEGEAEAILQHSAADRSSSSSTGATSMGQAGKGGATSGIHSSSSSSRGGAAGAGAGAGKGASQGRLKQADLNATIVTLNLPLLGVVEVRGGFKNELAIAIGSDSCRHSDERREGRDQRTEGPRPQLCALPAATKLFEMLRAVPP